MADYTFYDLASKGRCASWTPNPWKTRIALNFKGVPYKTEWLEYPDVAPTLESQGVPPNEVPPAAVPYSIPTLRFDHETIIMASEKIVGELEKRHPEPSLHLDSPYWPKVSEAVLKIQGPLRGVWMPQVPQVLLNPRSKEYFERTRQQAVGMPLDQFAKEHGGEEAWHNAKPGFDAMAEMLKENGGPFLMGETVSYADFVFVVVLHFFKRLNEEAFQRALTYDASFGKLYHACEKWLERDDH